MNCSDGELPTIEETDFYGSQLFDPQITKRFINHFGFRLRYPDGRAEEIQQGFLHVGERIDELIERGPFDYELFRLTPHGDEILVSEIPQCSQARPEAVAARAAADHDAYTSERGPPRPQRKGSVISRGNWPTAVRCRG